MNELPIRRQILTQAAALLAGAPSPEDFLPCLGALYRLSCTDAEASDEAASLVDEAEALLLKLVQTASRLDFSSLSLPDISPVQAWFAAPRDHYAAVLGLIDHLGAILAALALVAPGSSLHQQADIAMNELTRCIEEAAARSPRALLNLSTTALERMATTGVVPGADRALLALDAVARRALASALQGEPLTAACSFRIRPLDAKQADALGRMLATAMQRSQPLQVAPDLLQLVDFPAPPTSSRRTFDLTLHGAPSGMHLRETVELMQNVHVTVTDEEIEVELQGELDSTVLLVPLHRGEPGRPCPSRSGNHPRHFVFTPPPAEEELNGYALVVGDRLAFLQP
ncbi:MAG: hypothetical protein RMJ98_03570 [Myxococcales bacterium]|nr:hypothetical protein [Polyangiaceae bacterium]MDW8248368.1 hypothetical protein [Myxococcales bacterium]